MANGRRQWAFDSSALVCGAGLVVAGVVARLPFQLPSSCPSVRWLGIECPGCGLSRAFMALTRGEVAAAWTLHPWSLLLFPLAVWFAVRPFAGWRRTAPPAPAVAGRGPALLCAALLLAFAGWAVLRALRMV